MGHSGCFRLKYRRRSKAGAGSLSKVEEPRQGRVEFGARRCAGRSLDHNNEVLPGGNTDIVGGIRDSRPESRDSAVPQVVLAQVTRSVSLGYRWSISIQIGRADNVAGSPSDPATRVRIHCDTSGRTTGIGEIERLVIPGAGGVDGTWAGLS